MDGIININKVKGMTSFDVVRKVKKTINMKKVGHTGTLDPMAEGVLPICIGKATKFAELIMSEEKIYEAEMKLGQVTDTYDQEGEVIEECETEHITEQMIMDTIEEFVGAYDQYPPKYSAIKVKGKRLYEYARNGEEVDIKSRLITIHEISNIEIQMPFVKFRVKCSKGTYIRSLCFDIARKLNSGAYMSALTRTKSGIFSIENAVRIDEVDGEAVKENLITVESIFGEFKAIECSEKFSKLISNGVIISDRAFVKGLEQGEKYRVYSYDEKFIGLGELTGSGFKIFKRYD